MLVNVGSVAMVGALALTGLVAVSAPAGAATQTPMLLGFDAAGADGDVVETVANDGSASLAIDVASRNGGVVRRSVEGSARSIDLPDHDSASNAARAAIRVRNAGAADALAPGDGAFEFGADFRLDQVSQADTGVDTGNTLLERGLGGSPSQFRLEVEDGRVRCRIKGDLGTRLVASSVPIVASQWYRAECARDGDTVVVSVTTYRPDGSAPTVSDSRRGATGELTYPYTTALSVGGRLSASGALVKKADQFNGHIDNAFLTNGGTDVPDDPPDPPDDPSGSVTLAGAGDLCGNCGRTATRVTKVDPDVVVTIGDHAYNSGTLAEFKKKYGGGTEPQRRWGKPSIKDITLPGYGNHDCVDLPRSTGAIKSGCDGAVAYFGPDSSFGTDIPGTPGSYYTVVGDWLLVHLNSAGDNGSGLATAGEVAQQNAALDDVLTADTHLCEMVIWHHPRYSSDTNGSHAHVDPWFDTAYSHGVDVVLNAHDRGFERFVPLDGNGTPVADGVRQMVVGTGGASPHDYPRQDPTSAAQVVTRGIITMELRATGYDWAFLEASDGAARDSGSASCHS